MTCRWPNCGVVPRSLLIGACLATVLWCTSAGAGVSGPWVTGNQHPEVFRVNSFDPETIISGITKEGMTDKQKAIAVWKYVMANVYKTPGFDEPVYRKGAIDIRVFDAMKLLHTYGYAVCGTQGDMLATLWEKAGLESRTMNIGPHETCEVFYDGAWHYIDPQMGGYIADKNGEIVSGERLKSLSREDRAAMFDNLVPPEDPHYKLDRFMRLWGDPKLYYFNRGIACHPMNFTLRPGETFTRYFWRQWEPDYQYTGLKHAHLWTTTYVNRSDPTSMNQNTKADGYGLYGNGEYVYAPDLSHKSYEEGVSSSRDVRSQMQSPKLVAARDDAEIVFHQRTPYVICARPAGGEDIWPNGATKGVVISGKVVGEVKLSVSADMGVTWNDYGAVRDEFEKDVTDLVKMRYQYWVKLTFPKQGSGLDVITLNTRVQVAPVQLPALEKGVNNIKYTATNRDVLELTPFTWEGERQWEAFKHPLTRNLQYVESQHANLKAINEREPAELVTKISCPGSIRKIDVGLLVAGFSRRPLCIGQAYISVDEGQTWQLIDEDTTKYATWYNRLQFSGAPKGEVKECLLKIVTGAKGTFPAGYRVIRVYAHYDRPSTSPLVITHGWMEDDKEKKHVEKIPAGTTVHSYTIDVAAELKPWSRKNLPGNRYIMMEVPAR